MSRIDEGSHDGLETLSAYMDGELPAGQRDGLLRAIQAGGTVRNDWCVYHCIGDVLRSDDTAYLSPDFDDRFRLRLEQEPFLFAPEVAKAFAARHARPAGRWRMPVSIAAGIAAVMVVGAVVVVQRPIEAPQTAMAPPAAIPQLPPQTPSADPSVRPVSNEYLMAHRNYSAGLAMRGVVSHVRTAGYDGK
jgi:sigma-E factor negative regulatory protein RseA